LKIKEAFFMKITKTRLKEIIKEEIEGYDDHYTDPIAPHRPEYPWTEFEGIVYTTVSRAIQRGDDAAALMKIIKRLLSEEPTGANK
jgi:hypothetical protein